MAPGEERVDVDSLKKGKHAYPPGSYIGGELIVLNAKAASEPLVFHLSTKSRQGRSNLVIQCGRFPAELNGNSVLEEAYSFLESRFRQYIRIQADFEGLEVLDVVTTKGKPKRIDIRYGVGGAILAQDGGVVHIVNDTVASWFPSQDSSEEARAQDSAGNHSSTKMPPAAQNSPLAAFPTSPPTSEPPMPVGQRELDTSNQGRVRKFQSREVDLQTGRTSHKKFKTESVNHDGKVMDVSSATSAHKRSLPETNSKPVSSDRQSVTRRKSIEAVSGGASRRSIGLDLAADGESLPSADAAAQITSEPQGPISADVISGASTRQVVPAKGVRISQLLANPMLLGSLSLDQREALRQAAEQKWLQRNPLFTPYTAASLGAELIGAQKPQAASGLRSTEVIEAVKPVPKTSNAQPSCSAATESNSSALAAKGGLDVPRTPTTGNVIYPSVERMHSWDASVFVNILAVVSETKGPRSMGQRGDILHRLRLVDPSHPYDGPWLSLFTRGEERRLPTSIPPGSVVLVRGAKLHRENYIDLKCPAHAGWTFSLLIPDASGNPQFVEGVGKRHVETPPISRIERDKMSELQRWYFARFPAVQEVSESGNDAVQKFLHERMSKRATTWSLVKDRDFCDLTVEVLHVRQAQYSTKREFIVTDYTKNDSFTFAEYSTTDIPEVGYITLLTLWDGVALSADLNVINDGDIVTFLNVNIKANSSRYGMEGNVREASGPNGVLYRRFRVLNPQADPLAIELMRRRDRLKAETLEKKLSEASRIPPNCRISSVLNQLPLSVSNASPALKTRYDTQPFSSIAEILQNPVPDNRFRLKAWVCKIQTRTLGAEGEESKNLRDLVVRRCKACDRYFEQKYCVWCKTMLSANLEYQYLFVIHLKEDSKDKTESLPVIISSKYLSTVLPSLPSVSMLGIDEEEGLVTACRQVEEMLQGCVVNGTRQCPLIDWSLTRLSIKGKTSTECVFASGMQRVSPNTE